MAFWGVYLKPSEPYTLHYDHDSVPNRLRITQATLGDAIRNSPARSIVRCSVGDKPAIAICSLSVKELTCCQLELEFEESHDVVFSVMGPRGVYLAGYVVAPAPSAHQHSVDRKGKEETTMEIAGCGDRDLHKDELDSNKTGHVKGSIDAQNTRSEGSDKNIKGGKRLLKCSRGKDGNECFNNKDQEKTVAAKTRSVFGSLLEKRSIRATEKKMKQNRKRKRKPNTSEAPASAYGGSGAHEGNHENLKERNKESKGCSRKKSKLVFMKMTGL